MRIINLEIPEQKKVIEEKVMVVLKFEDKSFVNGIIGLLNNPEDTKEMSKKGYEWVVKNRSCESRTREVEKRYFELLESYKGV